MVARRVQDRESADTNLIPHADGKGGGTPGAVQDNFHHSDFVSCRVCAAAHSAQLRGLGVIDSATQTDRSS